MKYYLVAPTLRAHAKGYFTYQHPSELSVGAIIMVEIGTKKSQAVIIEQVAKPRFVTKAITSVVEVTPLPPSLIRLAEWLGSYYMAPTSSVWQTMLPRGLSKKRRDSSREPAFFERQKTDFTLTSEQIAAIKKIEASNETTALLQGVTGSGKTAVYKELAEKMIKKHHKSVIILVPEIALTSQFVAEFKDDFSDILLTHSKLSEAERHKVWREALISSKPRLVIGPRSALFMPLRDIGLIIIDEAHEPSLKQDQAPRYSSLRAGRMLAAYHGAKLVLGSATPSVVDRYLAENSKALIVNLSKAAKKAGKVTISVIDNRKKNNFSKHRFLSNALIESIEKTLATGQQVLLFHNRRGSSPISLCENCGWMAMCRRCFVPLVLHNDSYQLVCHVCGIQEKVPSSCPECRHTGIIHKGIGTKLIESELKKLFPQARIGRFDGDNTEEQSLRHQYQAVYEGTIDIIVGTQVVAKGLDLPRLAMVGIVQADNGLSLPDFYSEERVFQLLYQVMGRVGRDEKLSTIIVQTYQPEHISVEAAVTRDYELFYNYALRKRKHDYFPPFSYLLKLTCIYNSEKSAAEAARKLKTVLEKQAPKGVQIFGPAPAFYERIHNTYRWQLIVKSSRRSDLVQLLEHLPPVKWQSELDPISLL